MAKMITVNKAANLKKVSPSRIRILCRQGRIEGAELFGRDWSIPDNFEVIEADRKRPGKIKMIGMKK